MGTPTCLHSNPLTMRLLLCHPIIISTTQPLLTHLLLLMAMTRRMRIATRLQPPPVVQPQDLNAIAVDPEASRRRRGRQLRQVLLAAIAVETALVEKVGVVLVREDAGIKAGGDRVLPPQLLLLNSTWKLISQHWLQNYLKRYRCYSCVG